MKPNSLVSPIYVKNLLQKHGLVLSRGRGQNLLIDGNILQKIVQAADLHRADAVLEIGGGLGTLTLELCRRAGKVITVESDRGLARILTEQTSACANLELIERDIMQTDLSSLKLRLPELDAAGGNIKVVSNLPYSLAGPILIRLLESRIGIGAMVCMVQKEVGARIVAAPGNKTYGILSAISQMHSQPRLLFKVKRTCFFPAPRVDSVVLGFKMLPGCACAVTDLKLWKTVVEEAFARRRKTLKNALASGPRLAYTAEQIVEACRHAQIDPRSRAERLSVEDFARLSDAFSGI